VMTSLNDMTCAFYLIKQFDSRNEFKPFDSSATVQFHNFLR
jgi:hypothetical protein